MGCNSSGLITLPGTDAALIHKGRCRLMSIKASASGGSATVLSFYDDGAGAPNNEIARIEIGGAQTNLDFDFHGAICINGISYKASVAITTVSFSVQFV